MRVEEHTTRIDHVPVFYRSAGQEELRAGGEGHGGAGAGPPLIYLHGAPTSSDIWVAFLERTGGLAPDLIGFGRSGKGGHLDFTPTGLTNFLERWLEHVGVERFKLVGHGWGGAIGLLLAARAPERVERLVLIDAVPLLDGFRWPGMARLWRRPLIGELVMGATTRRVFDRQLRAGAVRRDAWQRSQLNAVWEQFDQGTQRALLRLHRATDELRLPELGAELSSVRAPTLVVWGERDPWVGPVFADAYAAALPEATVHRVPEAGHWPWLDQPQVIERVAEFVAGAGFVAGG